MVRHRALVSGQNGWQSLAQGSQVGSGLQLPRKGRQSLEPAEPGNDLPFHIFTLGPCALVQREAQLLCEHLTDVSEAPPEAEMPAASMWGQPRGGRHSLWQHRVESQTRYNVGTKELVLSRLREVYTGAFWRQAFRQG